jgi:hypothetical protein
MIKTYRDSFNSQFTNEKYNKFLSDIEHEFNYKPGFRIAETPIFIPKSLQEKLTQACTEILSVINQPNFKELTKDAINHPSLHVPMEDNESKFIQLDFGICKDSNGNLTPKLIELQGFPTLYFYQDYISQKYKEHFDIPDRFSVHPNGLTRTEYIEKLRQIIVGDADPKQVILLEIEPEKQATRIDFLCTEKSLGIKTVCISQVKKKGRELFYVDEKGSLVKILKIYNRIIFDELNQRDDLKREFYFKDDVDVEWVGHPNWFFRISKYTMPLLSGEYVPKSHYLDRLSKYPDNLKDYVLKPLYSFAGSGVQLNVTREILDSVENKSNYILQEKVKYEPVIETPDIPAKCEIRMMTLFNKKENKTEIVSNLARLSKGEMIGVKYNKDKEWVGGSIGYFENDAL